MRALGALAALVDTRHEYRHLFSIYVPIAIGVFALIVAVMAISLVVFSRREPNQAARWYEHNVFEGSYAMVLVLIVVFLLYLTFTAEHRVDTLANRQRPAVTVDVTASKWEWQFSYRDYGFSVRSGTVGRQPLVVPAAEPIRFNLNSLDVIHAMWVPHLAFKRDLTPGATQVITLAFSQRGVFQGECAEFCGLRHSDMLFPVHVVDRTAFKVWASSGGKGQVP